MLGIDPTVFQRVDHFVGELTERRYSTGRLTFALGERVATWATAPDQTVFSGPFVYAARADGSVELTFTVPGDALGGRWALTAYGDRSTTPRSW